MSKYPKIDLLNEQTTPVNGVSDVGIEIRRADKRNPGLISHGYARARSPEEHSARAKHSLKNIIKALKSQPKPNLTRSEVQSFDETLKKDKYWSKRIKDLRSQKESGRLKQLTEHFKGKGKKVPESLKSPEVPSLDYKQIKNEAKKISSGVKKPTPQPTQVTQPTPTSKNPDLGGKVDYFNRMKKAQKGIQPAMVSEPIIINNRDTISSPMKFNSPNELNSYNSYKDKDMKKNGEVLCKILGCLKKVDPKTKLPGVMLDKAKDEKGVHNAHFMADAKTGTSDVGARLMPDVKPSAKTKQYAMDRHKQVLNELKDMPKPKLTKSDIEEFDKALAKSWGKAEGAPAPAPAPHLPKPSLPKAKSQKPSLKLKTPELQMSELEKAKEDKGKAPKEKLDSRLDRMSSKMVQNKKMEPKSPAGKALHLLSMAVLPSMLNPAARRVGYVSGKNDIKGVHDKPDSSKKEHGKKLGELKDMPKPKLPK